MRSVVSDSAEPGIVSKLISDFAMRSDKD
jgi:hypothetical protein